MFAIITILKQRKETDNGEEKETDNGEDDGVER